MDNNFAHSGDVALGDTSGQAKPTSTIDQAVTQPKAVKKFKITIGGESYFLVSDEPEERVLMVARLVDSQMRTIGQLGHSDDPKRVAVLVAMQCASKMLAATELVEKYELYHQKLLGLIQREMGSQDGTVYTDSSVKNESSSE